MVEAGHTQHGTMEMKAKILCVYSQSSIGSLPESQNFKTAATVFQKYP